MSTELSAAEAAMKRLLIRQLLKESAGPLDLRSDALDHVIDLISGDFRVSADGSTLESFHGTDVAGTVRDRQALGTLPSFVFNKASRQSKHGNGTKYTNAELSKMTPTQRLDCIHGVDPISMLNKGIQ